MKASLMLIWIACLLCEKYIPEPVCLYGYGYWLRVSAVALDLWEHIQTHTQTLETLRDAIHCEMNLKNHAGDTHS